ncbi:MAG: glycosyltransferase family 2 protein [Planctomycetaceae bacterium]|nr:MAG: glycosyltransferase family 2 protein [Planctomycetaceae bacterium]
MVPFRLLAGRSREQDPASRLMSLPVLEISVVLPVRNAERRIVGEVERILEALADLSDRPAELLVMDDASEDSTSELLSELQSRYPQVRASRLSPAQGARVACDLGLDQARGRVVLMQEDHGPLRIEDLRRLYRLAEDQTVVAARAHSTPRRPSGPLLARLQTLGDAHLVRAASGDPPFPGNQSSTLQMIRRDRLRDGGDLPKPGHSQRADADMVLESEWFDLTSAVS